jgi:hypothetical protein
MQPDGSETSAVSITVLSVKPMRYGKLFALASVELDIDGVRHRDPRDTGAAG